MEDTRKQSFKKNNLENIELSIYNCGWQKCDPEYTWGPGIRDHYLVHLVISGKGRYVVDGKEFIVTAGNLFFAKPNQLIQYTADANDPWEYYWVGYNGSNAAKLSQNLPFSEEFPVFSCENLEEAKSLLQSIVESHGLHLENETAMIGYLYLLFSFLLKQTNAIKITPPTTGHEYVKNAIKYIQFNYSHNIGVDDIADAVGVSRSHLYRVFMANVGQSPIDYLTEFRIGEACQLLKTSTLSIAEVAYSVGFSDQFYFSRVFKKSKGISPSKYKA